MGRLWVVADVTRQEQSQIQFDQQTGQLEAMRRLSRQLHRIGTIDHVFERTVPVLYELFGVNSRGELMARFIDRRALPHR